LSGATNLAGGRRASARLAGLLIVAATAAGCATTPARRGPPAPDAPFAFRDPAASLPAGTLSVEDAERLARGMEALREGELSTAKKRFSTGAARAGAPAPFRVGLAYAEILVSRYGPAREILEPLVRVSPGFLPAAEALADLDAAEGRELEALDRYRSLLSAFPEDPRLLLREGILRRSLVEKRMADAEGALAANDTPAARRAALAIVDLDGSSPAGYRYLSRAAEAEGRLEDAWDAAARAHALGPSDDAWSLHAAALATRTGRYAEAVDLYTDVARRDASVSELLDEARIQFQVQNLPEAAQRAALSTRVTRAQFAALAWWLVPEVRDARLPAPPEVAVDAVDRPESQALIRAIALGLFPVARETHRVGADVAVSRAEAAALFRRIALLAAAGGELPECLGQDPPPAAKLEKCGILPSTQSRTVTGREAVKGLEAAARAGRGGDAR